MFINDQCIGDLYISLSAVSWEFFNSCENHMFFESTPHLPPADAPSGAWHAAVHDAESAYWGC